MDWLAAHVERQEAQRVEAAQGVFDKVLADLSNIQRDAGESEGVEIPPDLLDQIVTLMQELRESEEDILGEWEEMEKATVEQWQSLARDELIHAGVSDTMTEAVVSAIGEIDAGDTTTAEGERESLMGLGKAQLVDMVVQGKAAIGTTVKMVAVLAANQKLAEAMHGAKEPEQALTSEATVAEVPAGDARGTGTYPSLSYRHGVMAAVVILACVGLAALIGVDVQSMISDVFGRSG